MRSALALLMFVVLAGLPAVDGALNGPRPYSATYDYMPELDAPVFTMASGEAQATLPAADGSFGFIATAGAELSGLTRVCWTQVTQQCAASPSGQLRIVVQDGGSFGLRLPGPAEAQMDADHAVAMFVDLEGEANLNSLDLGRSLLAPLVGGLVRLGGIAPIPDSAVADPSGASAGSLASTDAATTLEIHDGGTLRATVRGKGDPVLFAGRPVLAPVSCDLAVLPFAGAADSVHFTRARASAAREGLDVDRINGLMGRLYSANAGAPTQSAPLDPSAFGPYEDVVAALFGSAVLRLPTANAVGTDIAFARVSELVVRGTVGGGLAWDGRASLDVRDGHVAGANDLAGFGVVQMPWWSWVLWVAALAVWITRLVRKPDKHHETWDRYKWVGWVAGPLVSLVVFWLWDLELRAVLGLSLFSGDASGQVLLFVALLQVATFLAASFAAMAPLRMLLRNGSLLLHQGTFMGLAGAVAGLLGFLLIVMYLRSYLDVILAPVLAGVG